MSTIRKEIAEIPDRVADALNSSAAGIDHLASLFRSAPPTLVTTVARGSSAAVASYARTLFSTKLNLPTAMIEPSAPAFFGADIRFPPSWLLAISQSGRSPDIIETVSSFNRPGSHSIALVNDTSAPLADAAGTVLNQTAGIEASVAATKSVICSMAIVAQLAATLSQDNELSSALRSLPEGLSKALASPSDLSDFNEANSLFTVGRQVTLPAAEEAALKLKETCLIHAESVDGAEIMHGPKALVGRGFPILAFPPGPDLTQPFTDVLDHLRGLGGAILENSALEAHPLLAPLHQLARFYAALPDLADARGLSADEPRHLTKVTQTE